MSATLATGAPALDHLVVGDLVLDWGVGQVHVETAGPLGAVLRIAAGLPAADRCEATFRVTTVAGQTQWCRRYRSADRWLGCDTTVRSTPTGFVERRGPVAMTFAMTGRGQAVLHSIRFFGMRLPRRLFVGQVESVPTAPAGMQTTVTITLGNGRLGRLCYTVELTEVPQ